ncbi:protein of unknown function [Tenacibaculum sp. MAR_2009_124]|uniref:transglutaminase domain-containing protein n=1 Tax=Tenacibaculum sp. MAR_2009_124 TaxID=1250059 RepID=UPI00089C6616|nr:DUF3857 domain-containing protein [Tenacibaculum sp. MAR_2009_124]SEC30644.1 protein of unknown function [Tenacibaculum sp. MAR_2009_124]
MKKLIAFILLLTSATLFSQEFKFGKVSKEELMETVHPKDSTADASYLYKKRRTSFDYDTNKGFMVVTECHERIKIYTKEGFDYATKEISYYVPDSGERERVNIEKAYTFNMVDGKPERTKVTSNNVFEEKTNKYYSQKKITFPQVKEGSVLELKYKIVSPYRSINTLNFQYGIPVNVLDYQVKIPEYYIFNKRAKGFYSVPLKESSYRNTINFKSKYRGGGVVTSTKFYSQDVNYTGVKYNFNGINIPAMKDNEPYIGNIRNYRGGLEFELSATRFPNSPYKNYSTSWEDISKKIFNSSSFGGQLNKSGYYKDDLNTVLETAKTDNEKIVGIFNLVKSKMTWNGYHSKYADEGVRKAYKEGTGNVAEINLILTSMLRAAGLTANPVLVSTKSNGVPIFPTRKGFNYVISKVNFADGSYVLLDATEKFSIPNVLPLRCLNWEGREIRKNGVSNSVALVPTSLAKESNKLYVKVNEDLSVDGMYRTTYEDHVALIFRKNNESKKEEDIISDLENKFNIEIDNFRDSNKDKLFKKPTRSFKFTSEDLIEEINGKLYLTPLFFLAKNETPFKSNERNYPIDYRLPWQDTFSTTITVPENYSVESAPESIAIGLPEGMGVFKYQIVHNKNKIRVQCVLQMNEYLIAPNYYETVKDFYKQLVEKEMEKIVLVKS